MKNFNAIVFPDGAISKPDFINASYLFFDELYAPPRATHLKDETLDRMAQVSMGEGLDFVAARKKLKDAQSIAATFDEVQSLGLINFIDDNELKSSPHSENRLALLHNTIRKNMSFQNILAKAAEENPTWTDEGIGVSPPGDDPNFEKMSSAVSFAVRTIQRIDWATQLGTNLVVNSLRQYNAVKNIQVLAYTNPSVQSFTLVREFMNISVPHLVAKSYEDVLALREKLKDHIEPFKIEMRRLYAQLPTDMAMSKAISEIHRITARDVAPKMFELERYLRGSDQNILRHLISKPTAIATAATALVGYVVATLSPGSFPDTLKFASAVTFPVAHLLGANIQAELDKAHVKFKNPFTFAVLSQNEFSAES